MPRSTSLKKDYTLIRAKSIQTPWGKSQTITVVIEGITSVTTSSHGGLKLNKKLNNRIPDYLRSENAWYEEDVAWCIPYAILKDIVLSSVPADKWEDTLTTIEIAVSTLKHWYWEEYERYFCLVLKPGESSGKDEDMWKKDHENDLQVISAYGSWHPNVPSGWTGICCVRGASSSPHAKFFYFLVPEDIYTGGHFLVEHAYNQHINPL